MKTERTDRAPKFNLLKPDGVRSQGHSEDVSAVLLNDGKWYHIVLGSFKFYRVSSDKGVPFVTFKIENDLDNDEAMIGKVVEVFPASVCGIAYDTSDNTVSDGSEPDE